MGKVKDGIRIVFRMFTTLLDKEKNKSTTKGPGNRTFSRLCDEGETRKNTILSSIPILIILIQSFASESTKTGTIVSLAGVTSSFCVLGSIELTSRTSLRIAIGLRASVTFSLMV